MSKEAIGALVTPQKRPTMPHAAANCTGISKRGAAAQPNAAPMQKDGTISPPLYPAPSVRAVKKNFQKEGEPVGFALMENVFDDTHSGT